MPARMDLSTRSATAVSRILLDNAGNGCRIFEERAFFRRDAMDKGLLGNNVITQIGIVVRDIEKSSRDFAGFFGIPVPKWTQTDTVDKAQTRFRGSPSPARAKLAFMRFGSLDIELIEPDMEPSTWREHLDSRGEGVHHIAFVIEGMKEKVADLEAYGFPLQQKGEYTGGRYAYIETAKTLKLIVELLENDPK
jgi:methylmalonyl-CoA/ethylmalonyl-CoA epimerase